MLDTVRTPETSGRPHHEEREPVSRDVFLSAMRLAASPVAVITTLVDGQRMALTVSSFLSVSADPPLISVCVNRRSRMCEAMIEDGSFAVHILAEDQAHIADIFAGRPQSGEAYDFTCTDWADQGEGREPLMTDASIAFECSVAAMTDAGSHRLFIGAVTNLISSNKRPLLYWNRLYSFPSHTGDLS